MLGALLMMIILTICTIGVTSTSGMAMPTPTNPSPGYGETLNEIAAAAVGLAAEGEREEKSDGPAPPMPHTPDVVGEAKGQSAAVCRRELAHAVGTLTAQCGGKWEMVVECMNAMNLSLAWPQ